MTNTCTKSFRQRRDESPGPKKHAHSLAFTAIVAAVAMAVSVVSQPAAEAAPTSSASTTTAVTLAREAGFASINSRQLVQSPAVTAVALTPMLVAQLPASTASSYSADGVTINGESSDGTVTVARQGGFGVITNRHANVEYRYNMFPAAGTKITKASGGGLDQLSKSGQLVGHIDAAYAIDSTGKKFPASYNYDPAKRELVVKADTTSAKGSVFIDPSWRCWATASAYGAAWVLAAAAWVFTDGTALWVAWALRTWFGLSYNAADAVARACALH